MSDHGDFQRHEALRRYAEWREAAARELEAQARSAFARLRAVYPLDTTGWSIFVPGDAPKRIESVTVQVGPPAAPPDPRPSAVCPAHGRAACGACPVPPGATAGVAIPVETCAHGRGLTVTCRACAQATGGVGRV